jgi:hypothetical protein
MIFGRDRITVKWKYRSVPPVAMFKVCFSHLEIMIPATTRAADMDLTAPCFRKAVDITRNIDIQQAVGARTEELDLGNRWRPGT